MLSAFVRSFWGLLSVLPLCLSGLLLEITSAAADTGVLSSSSIHHDIQGLFISRPLLAIRITVQNQSMEAFLANSERDWLVWSLASSVVPRDKAGNFLADASEVWGSYFSIKFF